MLAAVVDVAVGQDGHERREGRRAAAERPERRRIRLDDGAAGVHGRGGVDLLAVGQQRCP